MQSKKLTRAQRIFVANNNLNTWDWEFIKDVEPNKLRIRNKNTNEIIEIQKLNKKHK